MSDTFVWMPTHEERMLTALEQIRDDQRQTCMRVDLAYHVLLEIRDELRKTNGDTAPVLGLARKPGSAIVKPKGRR